MQCTALVPVHANLISKGDLLLVSVSEGGVDRTGLVPYAVIQHSSNKHTPLNSIFYDCFSLRPEIAAITQQKLYIPIV